EYPSHCPTPSNGHIGIQLQASNLRDTMLPNNHPILFNDLITQTNTGVHFNPLNGRVSLSEPGYYLANWWITLSSSLISTEVQFALRNNNTHHTILSCSPAGLAGHISGNALIHVTHPNESFSLINHSGTIIKLGSTSIQASLILNKI
ncbi:MAG: hypothetical protein RSB96_03395, partial [Oscillospiraceae bacterium]